MLACFFYHPPPGIIQFTYTVKVVKFLCHRSAIKLLRHGFFFVSSAFTKRHLASKIFPDKFIQWSEILGNSGYEISREIQTITKHAKFSLLTIAVFLLAVKVTGVVILDAVGELVLGMSHVVVGVVVSVFVGYAHLLVVSLDRAVKVGETVSVSGRGWAD